MKIVITAGGTKEAIDSVRYIHNRSSGKQGLALAEEAYKAGHDVTLIHTLDDILVKDLPLQKVKVESAAQMYDAVHEQMNTAHVLIMVAAVADYTPVSTASHKIKKTANDVLTIDLKKTKDILASFKDSDKLIVGFAAETGDQNNTEIEYGAQKLVRKGCDFIVVNSVADGKTFGADTNNAIILFKDDRKPVNFSGTKNELAQVVLKYLTAL
ncbi:MAG: phosphopantothenoylcysteine decarboxylase [Micrococcaceae bacterium]